MMSKRIYAGANVALYILCKILLVVLLSFNIYSVVTIMGIIGTFIIDLFNIPIVGIETDPIAPFAISLFLVLVVLIIFMFVVRLLFLFGLTIHEIKQTYVQYKNDNNVWFAQISIIHYILFRVTLILYIIFCLIPGMCLIVFRICFYVGLGVWADNVSPIESAVMGFVIIVFCISLCVVLSSVFDMVGLNPSDIRKVYNKYLEKNDNDEEYKLLPETPEVIC